MECLDIKGVRIGEGRPKIIVSIMGGTLEESLQTVEAGKAAQVDCFEYRADFADDVRDAAQVVQDTVALAEALPENPLLFTFRSTGQGGKLTLPVEEYAALNRSVIEAEAIDLVDIETWIGDDLVRELVDCAHAHGVAAVVSYHNFQETPPAAWMVELMSHMVELGADIPKVAVMAHDAKDALELLSATEEMSRTRTDKPLLTMAMGREGSITRLTGELFGSALTFCSLEQASAPGQVDVARARRMMDDLHEVLK